MLYQHQIKAVDKCKNQNLALFHDCGTGKTLTMLKVIEHYKRLDIGPTLVVCPLSIIESAWIEDCHKFTPNLKIISLWDSPDKRITKLNEQCDIYVVNYDTFKLLYPKINEKHFKMLVTDESSKMKDPKSQITKALLSFAGIDFRRSPYHAKYIIPHRYCLTGTPAPNLEDEYWAQIKFITGRGNAAFSDNFFAFRSFYFYSIPIGLTGQKIWKFRTYTKEDFMSRMQPYCDVVRKEDALDLPAQVHEIRKIHLNANERKAYDTMKNELVLYLENTPIVAQTALVEVMKLRQLTSGFAYSANGAKKISPVSSKFIELKMLLQELGRKQVIIWANFKEEIEQLLTLDDSRALFSDTEDRSKDIADFKAGKFQYYIIHPQSGGHGLTFTNCNYSIYYSLCYSYELLKQSQDRIHRIGQTDKCTYYYLLADKTIDEVIYRAITNKEKASNIVLEFLKNEKISM